jgi:hypothetical protein
VLGPGKTEVVFASCAWHRVGEAQGCHTLVLKSEVVHPYVCVGIKLHAYSDKYW